MKIIFILLSVASAFPAYAEKSTPNDLVKFLSGKWDNISFEISDGKAVKKEEYSETMVVRDSDTVTITAHAFKDGKDLTKDMRLELRGNTVTMSQGKFRATESAHAI
jgi:hypothetical protein